MAFSSSMFIGTQGKFKAPKTSTGASNIEKHFLEIRPANASANELFCCSSDNTRHFPCLDTDSKINSSSSGYKQRKSTISIWPANFLAASFAQYTPIP